MNVTSPPADRRRNQRKVKPFYVAFSEDGRTFIPAYGVDISRDGVGILSQLHPPDGTFYLRIMLDQRDFMIMVKRVRESEETRDGKVWYAAGLIIVSSDDEDRKFIADFVAGLESAECNARLHELEQHFPEAAPKQPDGPENRTAQRKCKPFYIAVSVNGLLYIPAYGLDISRVGIRIFTEMEMPEEVFWIRVILQGHDFIVRAKKSWGREVDDGKRYGWMTGARFVEIEPVDREFVDCYVNDKPFYAGNKLLEALERLRAEPDRADQWLPPELRSAFLQRLVQMKRLAPVTARIHPLVRYRYEGAKTEVDQVTHLMSIESRISDKEGTRRYITRFGFDQTGANLRTV